MNETVRVSVVSYGPGRSLIMVCVDPETGRRMTRSAGTTDRGEALKAAGLWQEQLRTGGYRPRRRGRPSRADRRPGTITWDAFCERYTAEALPGKALGTRGKVATVFNWVSRVVDPELLLDLTAERISELQAAMREAGLSEYSIKGNLAHLGAALRWAAKLGLLKSPPMIDLPRRAKQARQTNPMKGRPITGEEFDRMLAATPKVLDSRTRGRKPLPAGPADVESWRYFLRGLWFSGLRLSEALDLWWDRDDKLCVDLSGKFPMLRIPADCEKGNQDRLLPMAPEFAEFLLTTPEAQRTGPVFRPAARREHGDRLGWQVVSKIICKIGEAAGVKVGSKRKIDPETGRRVPKFASAHDLRRSFGERWAARVFPPTLQELMRHERIETTMRYYVGRNAQKTAAILWEAHRKGGYNISDNIRPTHPEPAAEPTDATTGRE